MRNGKTLIIILALVLTVATSVFGAASPSLVSYQGRLTNASGTPITTATSVLFRIHVSQSATGDIWSETQVCQPNTDGTFAVNLGAANPLTDQIFGGEERWLSVTIGGVEIVRARITSVGYSQRVNTVDRARGGVISGSVTLAPGASKDGEALNGGLLITNGTDSMRVGMDDDPSQTDWCGTKGGRFRIKPRTGIFEIFDGLFDANPRWRFDHGSLFGYDSTRGDTTVLLAPSSVGGSFLDGNLRVGSSFKASDLQVLLAGGQLYGGMFPYGILIGPDTLGYTFFARDNGYMDLKGDFRTNSHRIRGGSVSPWQGVRASLVLARDNADTFGRSSHDSAGVFLPADVSDFAGFYTQVAAGKTTLGMQVGDDANDHIALMPSGNVGIKTSNPTAPLEVAGQIYSSSGGFKFPDGTTQSGSATNSGAAQDVEGTLTVTVTSTLTIVAEDTIQCPTAGYVLAIGSLEVAVSHTNPTTTTNSWGVSDDSITVGPDQDKAWQINGAAPGGTYRSVVSCQKIFPVSAGTKRFYLLGRNVTGNNPVAHNRTLSLVFIPKAYGTVQQVTPNKVSSVNSGQKSEEFLEVEELARLRTRVAELESQLERNSATKE